MKKQAEGQKRRTRCFVEPRDGGTNERRMMELKQLCGITESKTYCSKRDIEGESHYVIEIDDFRLIKRLARNSEKFRNNFRVFTQTEGGSAMKLWHFKDKKDLKSVVEQKGLRRKRVVDALSAVWPAPK